MKLKYYMRGLGIGIIITTILLVIGGSKNKITDEEIIERAKALGMVMEEENSDLKDLLNQVDLTVTPLPNYTPRPSQTPEMEETDNSEELTPAPSITPTQEPDADPTSTPRTPTQAPSKAPTKAPAQDSQERGEEISFTIKSGMNSETVSSLLKEKGIIDDAKAFNRYIVKVGKANIIRAGKFSIRKGTSYEDIVKIITRA